MVAEKNSLWDKVGVLLFGNGISAGMNTQMGWHI